MTKSESVAALGAAMAKAQGTMAGAAKDSKNPHFNSKYADLASIVEACRLALAANGIAVMQSPSTHDGNLVRMSTMLLHSSGEWIESDVLQVQSKDAGPQAVGSCLTYLRRYQLAAMVGVAPEDDDAEAAEGRTALRDQPANKAEVKRQWNNPPVPRAPISAKPNGRQEEPPPLSDKDIPFAWLLPLVSALALAGMFA
jgi:hypothetical protein